MGTSVSGTVFYGFDLDIAMDEDTYASLMPAWLVPPYDESGEPREGEEVDDHLARMLGWVPVPFPEHLNWPSRHHFTGTWAERDIAYREAEAVLKATPEYAAWEADRAERRRILKGGPGVRLERYGYPEGEACWRVSVTESERRIPDGGCLPLDVPVLFVQGGVGSDEWNRLLQQFVILMDLGAATRGAVPQWHVCVDYSY